MARGGSRNGTTGRSYANRTDLSGPRKPTAPAVAPAGGQAYGAQAEQIRSLRALPLAPANASTPPPPSATTPTGTSAAPAAPLGPLPAIDRPTERPTEPLTAGAATGPGPGSISAAFSDEPDDLAALVDRLAAATNSPEVAQLASYLADGRG